MDLLTDDLCRLKVLVDTYITICYDSYVGINQYGRGNMDEIIREQLKALISIIKIYTRESGEWINDEECISKIQDSLTHFQERTRNEDLSERDE